MSVAVRLPHTNPFATRRVRPGAIAFQFPDGQDVGGLASRFETCGHRGQIVGPHGCGKSTLLATLLPELEARGHEIFAVTLRAHERSLPRPLPRKLAQTRSLIVVIDGYEQLGRLSAWHLCRTCAWRGFGLLVTTHHACALPMLFEVTPSLSTAFKLVEHLSPASDNRIVSADVEALYARNQGNLRETLFGLYDLYEAQRQAVE